MLEPTQPQSKDELLDMIRNSYERFEALLTSLSEEQMTTSGVNGPWSVKDNIAHLTVWQNYQAARQEGALTGVEPPDPVQGLKTEDEENEYFYQKHKNQPLEEVLADFRAAYQRLFAATQALSWEALNGPFPWYDNNVPIGAYTLGNSAGHYEEHGTIIQRWLDAQQ